MIDPYIHRKTISYIYILFPPQKYLSHFLGRNFTLDKCITVHFQILITYQRRSLSSQLILPYVLHTIGASPAYVTLMRKILDSVSGYTRFVHTTLFYTRTCRLISYVPHKNRTIVLLSRTLISRRCSLFVIFLLLYRNSFFLP